MIQSTFKTINSFAGRWKIVDLFAVFFARVVPYLMVFVLIGAFFLTKKYGLLFFPLLSAFISRFVITQGIYLLYKKKRPSELKETKVLIPSPKMPSFPSGHASFFFGLSLPILFYSVPLGIVFIGLAFFNALARVFCGVHWFSDITAGFLTGLVASLLIYYLRIFII